MGNSQLYIEGINDINLTKGNFDIETQFFNRKEIEFFRLCLQFGLQVKGLESSRTSPLKLCQSKSEVLRAAKDLITEKEYKELSQYVELGDSIMSLIDFKGLAQKFISTKGGVIRKNFDEDAPQILEKQSERPYEVVICGYEHMKSFKNSVSRKNIQTIAIGPDGSEYKADRVIPHDEKATLNRKI